MQLQQFWTYTTAPGAIGVGVGQKGSCYYFKNYDVFRKVTFNRIYSHVIDVDLSSEYIMASYI